MSTIQPNQFQFQNFPAYRDVGGKFRAPINVYPPNTVLGRGSELAVVHPKTKNYRLQKKCNNYPASGMLSVTNEKDKISTINRLEPIKGDIIFGINPEYLGETFYVYFGLTPQQVNLILDYEAEVAIGYLKKHFQDQQRITNINVPIERIGLTFDSPEENFIFFCVKFKVFDKRINEIIKKEEEDWEELEALFGSKEEWDKFYDELRSMDLQLFSCFSLYHTMRKFNFLGVCEVVEKQENDNEIPFKRIRYQYHGEIRAFLLCPNIKKNAMCSCYWYKVQNIAPAKLLIYDSYADIDALKKRMISEGEKMISEEEKKEKEKEKVIKRGHFVGQVKDSNYMPYNRKNLHFLMQKFPIKGIKEEKLKNITSDEVWKLIHTKQKRKKLTINAYY